MYFLWVMARVWNVEFKKKLRYKFSTEPNFNIFFNFSVLKPIKNLAVFVNKLKSIGFNLLAIIYTPFRCSLIQFLDSHTLSKLYGQM